MTKSLVWVRVSCFVLSLDEMTLLDEMIIFVPADNLSCFKCNWAWVILPPPLEEIVSFIIVILEPSIKIFCFELSASFTFILSSVNGSYIVKEVALISPDMAGV